MAERAEGEPEILNTPKILGVVVAATTVPKNGNIRLKMIFTPGKTHANENKRTNNTHAYTMHATSSKEITHANQYLQVILL